MNALRTHWQLDPEITFLNHGSFGACPTAILQHQRELQGRIEREPVAFFMREFEGLLDEAREELGFFLGADAMDLAFVQNATAGVNTVLRSLTFGPGDELVTTDHVYNACRNAMEYVAAQTGAVVRIVPVPFPIQDPGEFTTAFLAALTDRTKLVLLDHITSPTGLILPIEDVLTEVHARGIDSLIDGAHAPGMLDLHLGRLQPTYYTGNCHKWLCTPKGAAFLFVQPDRQAAIRPLSISHGANSPRTDRSRFVLEFDWPGTMDPTAWLCIPPAIRYLEELFPGGFPALREHNHDLVLAGRELLCEALEIEPPAPESMLGSLASVPLPASASATPRSPMMIDPLQDALFHEDRIEVPVMPWPAAPQRLLRISGQAYNDRADYERLVAALRRHLNP